MSASPDALALAASAARKAFAAIGRGLGEARWRAVAKAVLDADRAAKTAEFKAKWKEAWAKKSGPLWCCICKDPNIDGAYVGDGDGQMKDGGRFAHPECYEKRELKRERDAALERVKQLEGHCAQASNVGQTIRRVLAGVGM